VGILAFVGLMVWAFNRPEVKQAFATMQKANQAATVDMPRIKRALDQYKADKGKYPAKLKDLVPNYVSNEGQLRPANDPGQEFDYKQPGKDASPSTVVLEYHLPPPVPSPGAPPITLRMRLDGRVEGMDYDYQAGGGRIRIDGSGR
jgi:hypothetical protein